MASWLLDGPVDRSLLIPSPMALADWGVPEGTLSYVTGLALASAVVASSLGGQPVCVSELGVAIQLYLPYVMAAAYRAPAPPPPPAPEAAPGGGWLAADLGAPGDREMFETLLSTLPGEADAVTVATEAQEWRLPVCDYRSRPASRSAPPRPGWLPSVGAARRGRHVPPGPGQAPLAGVEVLDLTAMWAGPLATWLLQTLGARIRKVEPDARLDGTRAASGGGIYPDGVQRAAGEDSALWNALNAGKTRLPLDLREPGDRSEFLKRAAEADLVIDSFSPRVLPNFGLDRARAARVWLSLPAFGPGPRRTWVAYGTGVHAALGLGYQDDGGFAAPAVAYPDPLAGFSAALVVLLALAGGGRSVIDLPVADTTSPLLDWAGDLGPGQPAGAELFAAGLVAGEFRRWSVAGVDLDHPVGPFKVLPPS